MKFLYILTSVNEDLYYEQIYLSITSLLLYNPEAFIVLLTDDITVRSLTGPRSKILELVKECKVISLPTEQSKKVRSRLLKTNMRNLIEGKFLYLDCDTVVLSPIEIPDDWSFNIGAVKNLHFSNVKDSPIYPILNYFAKKCDINISSGDYFNSGVLYVRDNIKTRDFFSHWHKLYIKYLEENDVEVDQLSLYKCNSDYGGAINEIPGEWNWQVGFGINHMCGAKVMHTFSSVTHQFHNIHFLKRKDFYLGIKNGLYEESDIFKIIYNARSCFDEKLRIIPTNSFSSTRDASLIEFCSKHKQIYFYGNEELFYEVVRILHQNGKKIDGLIYLDRDKKAPDIIGFPILVINDLQESQFRDVGIIMGLEINQINIGLSILLSHKLVNIHIYI